MGVGKIDGFIKIHNKIRYLESELTCIILYL